MTSKTQNKTQPTKMSVASYLNTIENPRRRRDCKTIDTLMREVSGDKGVMWGESIVGYGTYHYRYDSGREGDFLRMGFSNRKAAISLYIMPGYTDFGDILKKLGPHKKGRSCLYIKSLDDIDLKVLKQLMQAVWDDMKKRYPN